MIHKYLLLLAVVVNWVACTSQLEPLKGEVDERIWNGKDVQPGQFPYQALLLMTTSNGMAFCGGSLISANYILTAAHCCANVSMTTVYLGLVRTSEMNSSYVVRQNVNSQNMIIHEQYNPNTISNDICLLRLPSSVQTNENISTIALPPRQDMNPSQYNGMKANISGWGQTNDLEGLHNRMQWSTVNLRPHIMCSAVYLFINKFTNSQLCSGKLIPWTGPCHGDSGGPLTIQDSATGKTIEIGLVSWGVGGCAFSLPVVYTYVPAYLNWINQHMT